MVGWATGAMVWLTWSRIGRSDHNDADDWFQWGIHLLLGLHHCNRSCNFFSFCGLKLWHLLFWFFLRLIRQCCMDEVTKVNVRNSHSDGFFLCHQPVLTEIFLGEDLVVGILSKPGRKVRWRIHRHDFQFTCLNRFEQVQPFSIVGDLLDHGIQFPKAKAQIINPFEILDES